MASVDGQEYASPSKRIKLDLTDHLANSNVELDFGTHCAPITMVHESVEGPCSSSSTSVLSPTNQINFSIPSGHVADTSLPSCSSSNNFNLDKSDKSSREKDDERDEVSSTVSNLSDLSGLSEISGQEWKPMAGPMCWVQKQMMLGADPRALLSKLLGEGGTIPADIDDLTLWKIIVNIMTEPPRRPKLKHVNTLSDVVGLLRSAKKIIVLTGAGVSVSCGIPDFRSRGGIYSRLALDFPDLPDPQSMFDIGYFRRDPRPFFKFAREIYPGQFSPSPCHRFIRALERQRKLLRNYSQNIDTLEQVAGIENVIECHGSFATASCTNCKHRVSADEIRADVFAQRIPLCPLCHDRPSATNGFDMSREYYKELVARGIMKPDIVFFGEGLPDSFHDSVAADKDQVDLMIVIGSTLKVRPVALIPSSIPPEVPQILINREPLPHLSFDVELLGDSDVIINQLCHMLGPGWEDVSALPSLHEACRLRPQHPWEDSLDAAGPSCSDSGPSSSDSGPSSSDSGKADSAGCVSPKADREPVKSFMVDDGAAGKDFDAGGASQMSFMSVDSGIGLCNSKERHMSIDSSTRDSGLCVDSPESAEFAADKCPRELVPSRHRMSVDSEHDGSSERRMSVDSAIDDGHDITTQRRLTGGARGGWAAKPKESLASRLPDNSFYRVPPSRYVFPGAEVFCETAESDQSLSGSSDGSQSDDSDDESDANASFWSEMTANESSTPSVVQ